MIDRFCQDEGFELTYYIKTLTKGSALNTGNGSTTSAIITGNGNLAPLFVPNRIPNSESYRSLTPLNMSANSPAHDPSSNPDAACNSSVQKVLQETSLEMIKISLISSEGDSAEVNLQEVPPQDSSNLQVICVFSRITILDKYEAILKSGIRSTRPLLYCWRHNKQHLYGPKNICAQT